MHETPAAPSGHSWNRPPGIVWRLDRVDIHSSRRHSKLGAMELRAISDEIAFPFYRTRRSGDYAAIFRQLNHQTGCKSVRRSICIRFVNARSEICRFNWEREGGWRGQGSYSRRAAFCSRTRSKTETLDYQWNFQRAKAGRGKRIRGGRGGGFYSPNGM